MAARAGRRGLMIVLTVAAVAVCLLALATWGYWPWRDKPQVAVPPPTASPVRSCRHTCMRWTPTTARRPKHCRPLAFAPLPMPVEFWYSSHWWKQDPSFPDGQEGWGYQLVRSHGRYLIDDDGVG